MLASRMLFSWKTTPRRLSRDDLSISLKLIPAQRLLPLSGWYSPARRAARVDFPDPLAPTTAVRFPAGISKLRPSRTRRSGL